MKTIDRFIVREFARYFVYAALILVFIYVIIDLFEDLGKFIERNVSLISLVKYYALLSPSYFVLLMPVAALMACFLVLGFMTRHREIIALRSGGVSIWRLGMPVLGLGSALVVGSFLFNETVTVWANYHFARVKTVEIDKRPPPSQRLRRTFFYYGEHDRIFFIRQLNPVEGEIFNFTIWEVGPRQKIKRRLDAARAKWRDGRWTAFAVVLRDFTSDTTETISRYDSLCLAGTNEKPGDFLKEVKPLDQANVLELTGSIRRKSRAGDDVSKERVELNYRISFPFINLILLLLGFPLSLVLRKGGVAFGIGLGLVFAFTYWGLIQTFRAYGVANIVDPFLAAWIPNLVFTAAGITLLATTRQ